MIYSKTQIKKATCIFKVVTEAIRKCDSLPNTRISVFIANNTRLQVKAIVDSININTKVLFCQYRSHVLKYHNIDTFT